MSNVLGIKERAMNLKEKRLYTILLKVKSIY